MDTYLIPEEVLTTKSDNIREWEVIEDSRWVVHGSSSHSPDDAKRNARIHARQIRANALVRFDYYKTVGSSGNYNYTIHNFRGRAVVVARKSKSGRYQKHELMELNEHANIIMKKHDKDYQASKKKAWRITWLLSFLTLWGSPGAAIIIFVIGSMIANRKQQEHEWLDCLDLSAKYRH